MRARLVDGPRAGFTDHVRIPAEPLVYVAFCGSCNREHLHKPLGEGPHPTLYVRSLRAGVDGEILYEAVDADDVLERIRERAAADRLVDLIREGIA